MAQKDSFFLPGKQKGKDTKTEEKLIKKKSDIKLKINENFDKNCENIDNVVKQEKKPFDKKSYRLKKYSKEYKLQQFEEQRKKKMLHKYQKALKNETPGSYKPIAFDEDITDSNQVGRFVRHPDFIENHTIKSDQKPKTREDHLKKMKDDKMEKQKQIMKIREEKAQKLAEYKKKKQERFKKLSMKNKKGQPVMALRMELLLDKLLSGSK